MYWVDLGKVYESTAVLKLTVEKKKFLDKRKVQCEKLFKQISIYSRTLFFRPSSWFFSLINMFQCMLMDAMTLVNKDF